MNDPNKRIDVNLSSLVSLKAELLRKQEEVNRAKQHAIIPTINYIPKHNRDSSSNKLLAVSKKASVKTTNDDKVCEKSTKNHEDDELLARSKRILEAKTKLYDRLSASGGSLNSNDTCLVMFDEKKQFSRNDDQSESDTSDYDSSGDSDHPNEQWTEYTDCLGRTRKCLRKDVEMFKKRDNDLAKVVAERQATYNNEDDLIGPPAPAPASSSSQSWYVDTAGVTCNQNETIEDSDNISMTSKSSKLEEIRRQWEEKERENMQSDQIHYQDILFDEARTHGVGYYAFSADHKERARQQQTLESERQRTLEAQKQREEQRINRDEIIALRVLAAKNRQRARLGLPPLSMDDEEMAKTGEQDQSAQSLYNDKTERKKKKKEESERIKREKEERERELERQQHVRPWDKPKIVTHQYRQDGSEDEGEKEWQYKPEKRGPMSQEEWNEKKRAERVKEFAPVSESNSSRVQKKTFKRRNTEHPDRNSLNTLIQNELSDNEADEPSKRTRTEISPPLTFEYFGPSGAFVKPQQKYSRNTDNELHTSIEAGLRFLRNQSDKTATSSKQAWTAKADY